MTLLETLRLYPPVPHLVREAIADDEIMGEPVKARSQIWISAWVLHYHRKHPTAFMPGRFMAKLSPWTSPGAYMPLGAGPRVCVGATFAIAREQTIGLRYCNATGSSVATYFRCFPSHASPSSRTSHQSSGWSDVTGETGTAMEGGGRRQKMFT